MYRYIYGVTPTISIEESHPPKKHNDNDKPHEPPSKTNGGTGRKTRKEELKDGRRQP